MTQNPLDINEVFPFICNSLSSQSGDFHFKMFVSYTIEMYMPTDSVWDKLFLDHKQCVLALIYYRYYTDQPSWQCKQNTRLHKRQKNKVTGPDRLKPAHFHPTEFELAFFTQPLLTEPIFTRQLLLDELNVDKWPASVVLCTGKTLIEVLIAFEGTSKVH